MYIFAAKQKKVGSRNNAHFCNTCLLVHDIILSKGQHTESYFHELSNVKFTQNCCELNSDSLSIGTNYNDRTSNISSLLGKPTGPSSTNCPTNLPEQGKKLMYA